MELTQRAVDNIREAAIAKWGDDWLHKLVKAYNAKFAAEEDVSRAFSARWTQIRRIFEEDKPPNAENLLKLAKAAGMRSIRL